MNSAYNVIIRPVVSERSFDLMSQNKYTFEVAKQAPKEEIAAAVEKLFGVHVLKVNTINVKPKTKRVRYVAGQTRSWKKAIVTVAEGDSIELFAQRFQRRVMRQSRPPSMTCGRSLRRVEGHAAPVIRRHLAEATRRLSRHMPERVGLIP